MNYPCNLIKDLLPLYHDEVCSKESIKAIKVHLSECTDCAEYYSLLKDSDNLTIKQQNVEQEKANILRNIKKQLLQKKFIISLVSIVCAVAIMIGGFVFMNNYIVPVKYENNNITVAIDNGDLCAYLKGMPYISTTSKTIEAERNGKEENNIYFHVSSSLWSKLFSFNSSTQSKYIVAYNYISEQQKSGADSIDNIYYFVGDYSNLENLSENELKKVTNSAVLIWSKE